MKPWKTTVKPYTMKMKTRKAPMKEKVMTSLKAWNSKLIIHKRNSPYDVWFRDYQAKPELDRYEQEGIDDEGDHAELDY